MIYLHEVSRSVHQGVRGLPIVGSAVANPLLLATVLVGTIILICLLALPVHAATGEPFAWREIGGLFVRAFCFAIVPALLMVHVYGAGVAAMAERVHGGDRFSTYMGGAPGEQTLPPPVAGGSDPDFRDKHMMDSGHGRDPNQTRPTPGGGSMSDLEAALI